MKRIVAINCSPRSQWNTGTLVREAADGAKSENAEIEIFDLYMLEKFTGCISCFGCKLAPNEGTCICKDGLSPVLEGIRSADGLIIGTPNYLGDVSAGFRSLFERLIFQSLTYRMNPRGYNRRKIPVLFIMTSNAPKTFYTFAGYRKMLKRYQKSLKAFVGNTKVFIAGNTLQVKDYSRFNWTMFNAETKKERHDKLFPEERKKVFALGAELVANPW